MTTTRELGLHTVPSTWTRIDKKNGDFQVPYRRIVGIEHDGDESSIEWSRNIPDIIPYNIPYHYNPNKTTLEILVIPELMAERLLGFFRRFFIEEPRTGPKSYFGRSQEYLVEIIEQYNCHRFGYWMSGNPVAQEVDSPDPPYELKSRLATGANLSMGQHGVLRTEEIVLGGTVHHSVVGLGEDRAECIQVVEAGGHMGLDTYENILDYYEPQLGKDIWFSV